MPTPHSLTQIRRKRRAEAATLWFAQALIVFLRVIFRGLEWIGPPRRRQRLRALREKMDAINREGAALTGQIQHGDTLGALEAVEERLGRFASPADRADLRESAANVRAMRQELDVLKGIHQEAGDDPARAVAGYREYVQAHPDSHAGLAFLGGFARKAGDLDGSITAYSQAIQVAGRGTIPGNAARLQLGLALQAKGDAEAAMAEFRGIIAEATPETEAFVSQAYLSLGSALDETGQRDDARAAWKQAIRWDRTKIVARKARALLSAPP